jgi:hypothetical protein
VGKNLYGDISVFDAAGTWVGGTNGDKVSINAGNLLFLSSKLTDQLVVTGEHTQDYVQFTYGSSSWTSMDTDQTVKTGWCVNGGWNKKEDDISTCLDPLSSAIPSLIFYRVRVSLHDSRIFLLT